MSVEAGCSEAQAEKEALVLVGEERLGVAYPGQYCKASLPFKHMHTQKCILSGTHSISVRVYVGVCVGVHHHRLGPERHAWPREEPQQPPVGSPGGFPSLVKFQRGFSGHQVPCGQSGLNENS